MFGSYAMPQNPYGLMFQGQNVNNHETDRQTYNLDHEKQMENVSQTQEKTQTNALAKTPLNTLTNTPKKTPAKSPKITPTKTPTKTQTKTPTKTPSKTVAEGINKSPAFPPRRSSRSRSKFKMSLYCKII